MFEELNKDLFADLDNNSHPNNKISSNLETDRRGDAIVTEFSVKIINHKKAASFLETYLVYTIETSGSFRPYVVERRYNDFQWLHQRLVENYPMSIVPPLSSKHNLTAIERFSGTFIERRRDALDKFLQRLTEHHILGVDKEFWSFLTQLPAMFQELKRTRPVLGKVESLLQTIQNLSAVASASGNDHNIPDSAGFHKLVDDSARFGDVMTSLGRVIRRTEDVWDNISSIVGQINSEEWAALGLLSVHSSQIASAVRLEIEPWVVESSLYWAEVERVARRRNDAEARFLASVIKQSRVQAARPDLSNKQDTNKLHDVLSKSNADLTSELDRFKAQRSSETRDWLKRFADIHVDHYKQTSAIWRQMVAGLSEAAID